MDSVTIKNAQILGGFGQAFQRLCQSKMSDPTLKFKLLQLRKQLAGTAEDTLQLLSECETPESRSELLEIETAYNFKRLEEEVLLNHVSVEDVFLLTPIVKEA